MLHKTSKSKFSIVLLLLISITLFTTLEGNLISLTIAQTNSIINMPSNYTFQFDRRLNPITFTYTPTPAAVPLNSKILIIFPNQYLSLSNASSLSCLNSVTSLGLTCNVNNGNLTITITDYYSGNSSRSDAVLNINIFQITNAYKSGVTNNFQYYIVDPLGNVIDQSPSVNNNVFSTGQTFSPGVFSACSVSAKNAYISTSSKLTFTLTPTNSIPSTGQIVIQFPFDWNADYSNTQVITSTPNCQAITNISSSMSCTLSTSPLLTVTLSALTSTTLASTFSFTVDGVYTPPFVDSTETITIYSQWSDLSQIDTCAVAVSNLNPAPFQSIAFTSQNNQTVSSTFSGSLSLQLSRIFQYQDTMSITLPNELISAQISSNNFASFTLSKDLSTITLSNFPSIPETIGSNNLLSLVFSNISNPTSTRPITLSVTLFRSNKAYQSSSVVYSAVAGIASNFQISTQSAFVRVVGQALISIQSGLILPANSTISITYPSTISAADTIIANVTSASLGGILITNGQYKVTSNQISFTNVVPSAFNGVIELTINNLINPPNVQPNTYLLTIQDSLGYSIIFASYTMTASLKTLIANTVSSSSLTVLDGLVTYTVAITTNYDFTAISIVIPNDIVVASGFQSTCSPNSFSSCALVGSNLTFIGALSNGSYLLTWGNNINPNSLAPTASFKIYTYSRGWGVEISQGFLSITMQNLAQASSILAYPSSYLNSAVITVTISNKFPNLIPSGVVNYTFPNDLDMTNASCPTCIIIANSISVNINANTTNFTLTVVNVKNAGSFKPINDFGISLKSNNGYGCLSSQVGGWTNNILSSFVSVVTSTNGQKGETGNFNLQLTSLSSAQSYVIVDINSQFTGLTNATAPIGSTLITPFSLKFASTSTSITLTMNLITPIYSGNFTFLMTTFTSGNYAVGSSTSNIWQAPCASTNCRTCNGALCLSCYSNTAISIYTIYNVPTSSCISACLSGSFSSNSICNLCDSNCKQCSTSSSKCTSCVVGLFLDTTFNVCVSACRSTFYANSLNQQCTACNPPCFNCTSSVSCTSCVSSTYLLGSTCRSNCPINQYVNNDTSLACDACNSSCLTCLFNINNCTSCDNSLLLFFELNKCVRACSANYFLKNNVCTYCELPCKVCINSTTICSSCFGNASKSIWYAYSCIDLASCPIGNYINTTNSSCNACPTQCLQCTSLTICSTCSFGFYLLNNQCISQCPNTTYVSASTCLPCNNCSTCNSSSFCTACTLGLKLLNGICYSTCPSGTFSNALVCTSCATNCPTCKDLTYCYSCISQMFLGVGICYQNCPSGTYANATTSTCDNCPSSCSKCTSLTNCQTCSINYSLQNSQCVLTCSHGVSSNQICYPCGLNCAICSNFSCQLCSTSFYIYNNICLSQCPTNMLSLDSVRCVLCTQKFSNCTICNFSQCLSCSDGTLNNGSCIPCPEGTYQITGSCPACPSTCQDCSNSTNCLFCRSGYYLENSLCVSSCPLNKVPNGTICTICAQKCTVCNLTNSLCSVCNAGVYLYNNLCMDTCPSGLVISYDFFSCQTPTEYYKQFSQAAKIIPFPFSIATAIIIIILSIIKCTNHNMHLRTTLAAFVGMFEVACWVLFLAEEMRLYLNYHAQSLSSFICIAIAILFLLVLNWVHLKYYFKVTNNDNQFMKWNSQHCCVNLTVLSIATALNFRFYRLIHSKFLERQSMSMVLATANKLVPWSVITFISLFVCSLPILIGCGLAAYNSISQDQQFFVALDTLIITGIMILLLLVDLKHPSNYFIDEHETNVFNKKTYLEESEKVSVHSHQNPMVQNMSRENLINIQEDQAATHALDQETKMKSTFQQSHNLKDRLTLQIKDRLTLQKQLEGEEESKIEDEDEIGSAQKIKGWEEKMHDHYGYLIKKDQKNNIVRFDQHGYRVEIDSEGKHHKYDLDGNQIIIVDGKHIAYDQDGFIIKNGKRYDQRGYQVRHDQKGDICYYDKNGYKVEGKGSSERIVDQQGNTIVYAENGEIHKFNKEGYEVIEGSEGEIAFKNEEGQYIRKNKKGDWQMYDPSDDLLLVRNQLTGEYDKYDELGYKVVKDKFGNQVKYDGQGYKINVLPDGGVIRYDGEGYRVEKDGEGNIHRYDKDGYEVVVDEHGNKQLFDSHGYQVTKDYYGTVSLYDKDGYLVIIDPDTKLHRKFNAEGLEVRQDSQGNTILVDKRGRIVKEIDGETYQKYDAEGNKIWLDEDGCEIETDQHGNMIRFDKVGDIVENSAYENSEEEIKNLTVEKEKKRKYQYKAKREDMDLEEQFKKMNVYVFEDEDEIYEADEELQQFHDFEAVKEVYIEEEFEGIIRRERDDLTIREDQIHLEELQDIENTPYTHLKEKVANRNQIGNDQQLRMATRELQDDIEQHQLEIKSAADVSVHQRSFENDGVQPLQNRSQNYNDEVDSIDELNLMMGKKKKRGGRSEISLDSNKDGTKTVYNFNQVDAPIKNQHTLYNQDEEIQSLHEEDWEDQLQGMNFIQEKDRSSNAHTNILYVEDNQEQKDALSDYLQENSFRNRKEHDLFSGNMQSIQEIQDNLFNQLGDQAIRERRQFKLSGAPNPLVEYAKTIEAQKKSLQEKLYLQQIYKK